LGGNNLFNREKKEGIGSMAQMEGFLFEEMGHPIVMRRKEARVDHVDADKCIDLVTGISGRSYLIASIFSMK
jgi:hypothetical protein